LQDGKQNEDIQRFSMSQIPQLEIGRPTIGHLALLTPIRLDLGIVKEEFEPPFLEDSDESGKA
jgi:hypothetical protein